MEKGSRANHVILLNDASWAVHHPLWLKVKQLKQLPVISSRRKPQSHGCLWLRRQPMMDLRSVLLIPTATSSSPWRNMFSSWFLAGGFFPLVSKTIRTNVGTFPSLTSRFRYLRLDNDMELLFVCLFFQKLLWFCCYTKNRDLHCMVLDLFTF